MIYTWRRKLRETCAQPALPDLPDHEFAEAVAVEGDGTVAPGATPATIVALGRGKRVTVFASASPALAAAALQAFR